ncbi:MAG: hypothetical protein ACT4N2_13605 [Hyphomicrobium sp.]
MAQMMNSTTADFGRRAGALRSYGVLPLAVAPQALVWSGAGFILGAVFWHFVGFWGFVSEIVYAGPGDQPAVAAVRRNAAQAAPHRVPAHLREAAACVKLVLDRAALETRTRNCSSADRRLPHIGVSARGDRATGTEPGAWVVRAEQATLLGQD